MSILTDRNLPNKFFEQRYGDLQGEICSLVQNVKWNWCARILPFVDAHAEGHVSELLPSPSDFNHCITTVHFRDSVYWFDPTISKTAEHFVTSIVRIMAKHWWSEMIPESLSTIPVSPPEILMRKNSFLSDTLQLARLIVTTAYSGSDAGWSTWTTMSGSSLDEVRDLYLNYYGKTLWSDQFFRANWNFRWHNCQQTDGYWIVWNRKNGVVLTVQRMNTKQDYSGLFRKIFFDRVLWRGRCLLAWLIRWIFSRQ